MESILQCIYKIFAHSTHNRRQPETHGAPIRCIEPFVPTQDGHSGNNQLPFPKTAPTTALYPYPSNLPG